MVGNVTEDPDVSAFLMWHWRAFPPSSRSYGGGQGPCVDSTTITHAGRGRGGSFLAWLFIREENILQRVPGDSSSISTVRIGSSTLPPVVRTAEMQGPHTCSLFVGRWALPAEKGVHAGRWPITSAHTSPSTPLRFSPVTRYPGALEVTRPECYSWPGVDQFLGKDKWLSAVSFVTLILILLLKQLLVSPATR